MRIRRYNNETHAAFPAEIILPNIDFGYTVDINLSIDMAESGDGRAHFYDSGSQYDFVSCKGDIYCSKEEYQSFLSLTEEMRGGGAYAAQYEFLLIDQCEGLFPFSPAAKGATAGAFIVSLSDFSPLGAVDIFGKRFRISIEFNSAEPVSSPTFGTYPDQGDLYFAGVQNLRFPESGFRQKLDTGIGAQSTYGGGLYPIASMTNQYRQSVRFVMLGDSTEIGLLASRLRTIYRVGDIPISAGLLNRFNIFGGIKTDPAFVKLADNRMRIKHISYGKFECEIEILFDREMVS